VKIRRMIAAAARYALALGLVAAIGGAVFGGVWAKDQLDRREASAAAQAKWRVVRGRVAARLNDQYALEFGAVWMTHAGRVCGLVNGGSSFGGLTGMTPFFADGDRVRFPVTSTHKEWAPGWGECIADAWYELEKGSLQTGYCATRAGRTRCKVYG